MLSPCRTATVAVLGLAVALLASAPGTLAASPASVTVRVEGTSETKVPPTQVTTTTAPVVKDGNPEHACPGTSAAGALELATSGGWGGKWFGGAIKEGHFEGLGYSVETVLGETHAFGGGAFWDEWVDNHEGEGLCHDEPRSNGQVLLFPCPETAKECPAPLGIEAPATAGVGEPVPVTVKRYSAKGEASPAVGVAVTGGVTPATTEAMGHAMVTFAGAGMFTLRATAPESVRTESNVCVHNGNDGTCGTAGPATTSTPSAPLIARPPEAVPYHGPYAVVARPVGLIDGQAYPRRRAPRVLAGTVSAHTAVTSVSLSLRRRHGRRCFAYSGARAAFERARCGTAPFFEVSRSSSFSYLLPAPLPPGRYVLDLQATDAVGNHTTLARGTSRIVFYVR